MRKKDSKTRRYLKRHAALLREVEYRKEKIKELEEMATCIRSATDYSDIRVKSSGNSSARYEEIVAEIDEKIRQLEKTVRRAEEENRNIEILISTMEDSRYRSVLWRRYVCNQKIDEIAACMGYSPDHIYRMHREAIERLA